MPKPGAHGPMLTSCQWKLSLKIPNIVKSAKNSKQKFYIFQLEFSSQSLQFQNVTDPILATRWAARPDNKLLIRITNYPDNKLLIRSSFLPHINQSVCRTKWLLRQQMTLLVDIFCHCSPTQPNFHHHRHLPSTFPLQFHIFTLEFSLLHFLFCIFIFTFSLLKLSLLYFHFHL